MICLSIGGRRPFFQSLASCATLIDHHAASNFICCWGPRYCRTGRREAPRLCVRVCGTVKICKETENRPRQPNQFAPAAVECPVCSTSRGQPPIWCDLWRCREMITKLHFEGVRRGIPGPTPSTGTNRTTGRGVSPRHPGRRLPPNFYTTGTNPRTGHHWTAFPCPVIRRRRRHWKSPQGKSKGENGGGVSAYLWRCPGETVSCGAAQFDPTRPPFVLCLGFSGRSPRRAPSQELAFRYPRGASWS